MNIVERVKRICLSPDTEWTVIAGESTTLAHADHRLRAAAGSGARARHRSR